MPPKNPRARSLSVERACVRCGAVIIYMRGGSAHHPSCAPCTRFLRTERIRLKCSGFDDHGRRRHSRTCRRSKVVTQAEIRAGDRAARRRHAAGKSSRDRTQVEEADSQYVCHACSGAATIIAAHEAQIRNAVLRTTGRAAERIRSGAQRREMLRELAPILRRPFLASRQAGAEKAYARRALAPDSREAVEARAAGIIVQRWSKVPPNWFVRA